MSFLALTLPLSLLLAGILTALAIRAVQEGHYDDWEGPAWRHLHDDDEIPEISASIQVSETEHPSD